MRFAYPDDVLGAAATLSSSIDPSDDFPLSQMHDGVPTEVARWDDGSSVRVIWSWGGATSVQGVVLTSHNVEAGEDIVIAGHTSNAWGAPAYSTTVVAPARDPHNKPKTIAVDLSGTLMDTTGYAWMSILLPAQSAAHVLGEVSWIRDWQDTDGNQRWNFRRADVRRPVVNETSWGVRHVVDPSAWRRRLVMEMIASDDDRDKLMTLYRQAGTHRPWPLIVTPTSIISESLFGTFSPYDQVELEEEFQYLDFHVINFTFLELERGIF